MTPELREVLHNLTNAHDAKVYTITTIEYPCDMEGSLKTVTRMCQGGGSYVDIYRADGTTKESRELA